MTHLCAPHNCPDRKAGGQVVLREIRVRDTEAQEGGVNFPGTPSHRQSLGVPKHPASEMPSCLASMDPSDPVLMTIALWVKKTIYVTGQHTHTSVCRSFVQQTRAEQPGAVPGGEQGHPAEKDRCRRARTRTRSLSLGARHPTAETMHVPT